MDWTRSYRAIMIGNGLQPYSCLTFQCGHISKSWLGFIIHNRFGPHKGGI